MPAKKLKWIVNERAGRATCLLTRGAYHPEVKRLRQARHHQATAYGEALKRSNQLDCGTIEVDIKSGYRVHVYLRKPSGAQSMTLARETGKFCNLTEAKGFVESVLAAAGV